MKSYERDLLVGAPFSYGESQPPEKKAYRKNLRFEYQGKKYSLTELERISGTPRRVIDNRLRRGWSVDRAVETPKREQFKPRTPKEAPKQVLIAFDHPVTGIFVSMQPELNRPYLAEIGFRSNKKGTDKDYYVIRLDNGKPLVVYVNECKLLTDGTKSKADSVYAVEPLSWLPGSAIIYYWDLVHLSSVAGPLKIYHRKDGSAYVVFCNRRFNIDESQPGVQQYIA